MLLLAVSGQKDCIQLGDLTYNHLLYQFGGFAFFMDKQPQSGQNCMMMGDCFVDSGHPTVVN